MPEIQPLTESEYDHLETLLEAPNFDEKAFPLDALQGFLCAVLSGPQVIPADVWIPHVLGGSPRYASDAQTDELDALLMRLHDALAVELRSDDGLSLIVYPTEEGGDTFDYATWCRGYLDGVDLSDPHWTEAGDDEDEAGELLLPFLALAGALDDDPALRAELEFAPGDEEKLVAHWRENLVDCVIEAHDYWQDHRLRPETFRRTDAKVGRNDPCPCGSGRKYKQCHGS